MKIYITKGTGKGKTELAAFDAALYDSGIANFNLIPLSSIIPPKSRVIVKKINWNNKRFGDKLYIVLAKGTQVVIGKEIWAGIGWTQTKDGRGIFVEHVAESRQDLLRLIKSTISNMKKYRLGKYGRIRYVIQGARCAGKPVCSTVTAVYKSENWE